MYFTLTDPSRETVDSDLSWIKGDITGVVRTAIQQFLDDTKLTRRHWRHGTEPSMISDLMVAEARRRFAEESRVVFEDVRSMDVLVVDLKYAIRFKQFGPDRKTAPNDTVQSSLFDSQQLVIPGLPNPLTFLNAGYCRSDRVELAQSEIVLTRPSAGGSVAWWIDLDTGGALELPLSTPRPSPIKIRQPKPRVTKPQAGTSSDVTE
jgi:hypothetical protein